MHMRSYDKHSVRMYAVKNSFSINFIKLVYSEVCLNMSRKANSIQSNKILRYVEKIDENQ